MRRFWQDVRFGLRTLAKNRGVTAIALLALTLGIGANTAIFSVVNALLFRPLPYSDPDKLVWFWESQPNLPQAPFAPADFLDFQAQNRSFEQLGGLSSASLNLTGHGPAERLQGTIASANVLPLLRIQPILGRSFLPEDGVSGAPRVAMLSYGLWKSRFGADPGIVGKTLELNGQAASVIGVLPRSFHYPYEFRWETQVWLNPNDVAPELFGYSVNNLRTNRGMHYLSILGRLKPGVTLAQAQADITSIFDQIHRKYSGTTGHAATLVPLREVSAAPIRTTLLVLLGIVGMVLLIACANVANLMLARAVARRREIAIRTALGAARGTIVRQLLTESTMLSLAGGAAGLALAWGLLRVLSAANLQNIPHVKEVGLDLRVLGFAIGASLLTGLLFGLAPALTASKQGLGEILKEGGRGGTTGAGHSRLRSLLVVSEVAVSLVLLVGAGLLVKSFVRLLEVKPGFRPDHLVTMKVNFTGARYKEEGRKARFVEDLVPRLLALPGIDSASFANDLPLEGENTTTNLTSADGHPPFPEGQRSIIGMHSVTPGFFQAMGIPLLRGREFSEADKAKSAPVVILNQKLAEMLWPGQDPLGRHIQDNLVVVGVVGNVLHNGLGETPALESYLPYAQNPWTGTCLIIRTERDPARVYTEVRSVVAQLDPEMPLVNVRSMDQVTAETLAVRSLTLWLVAGFASLAMVLAVVGMYGVMSYAVTERTHEIGVRLAMGAQRGDVLRLVVGQGMRLAVVGLVLGAIGALFATRAMASLLFGVKPNDPVTYGSIAGLLVVAALAACYLPARRATAVDPLVALRYE